MHPTEAPKKNWIVVNNNIYELRQPQQYYPCVECELEFICNKIKYEKICHLFPHDVPMAFRSIGQLYHDTINEEDPETDDNLTIYFYQR